MADNLMSYEDVPEKEHYVILCDVYAFDCTYTLG